MLEHSDCKLVQMATTQSQKNINHNNTIENTHKIITDSLLLQLQSDIANNSSINSSSSNNNNNNNNSSNKPNV